MPKVVALVLARMGSSRLEGKALKGVDAMERPLLLAVVDRLKKCASIEDIVVATSSSAPDDILANLAESADLACFRGSELDVLGRCCAALEAFCDQEETTHVVLAYGDNPLIEAKLVDQVVRAAQLDGLDYAYMPSLPLGIDFGVFNAQALLSAGQLAKKAHQREHVNAFFVDHPEQFNIRGIEAPPEFRAPHLRLTVDTAEDLDLVREVHAILTENNQPVDLDNILKLAEEQPEVFAVNAHIAQRFASAEWRRMRLKEPELG